MKLIGKMLLGAVAYSVGIVVTGMIVTALNMPPAFAIPQVSKPENPMLGSLPGSVLLTAGLMFLVHGLRGRYWQRFLAIGGLLFVALGVNGVIELSVFSNILSAGIWRGFAQYILPCAFAAGVLAWRGGPTEKAPGLPGFSAQGWFWRVVLAWLAFPVIYFIFGMIISPIVTPYYFAGVANLRIPALDVIVRTQFLRSALFLAGTLPALMLFVGSRLRLLIALGVAHAVVVGIYGLAQGSFLPGILRVTHSIEITADSFAYAAILVLLFSVRSAARGAVTEREEKVVDSTAAL